MCTRLLFIVVVGCVGGAVSCPCMHLILIFPFVSDILFESEKNHPWNGILRTHTAHRIRSLFLAFDPKFKYNIEYCRRTKHRSLKIPAISSSYSQNHHTHYPMCRNTRQHKSIPTKIVFTCLKMYNLCDARNTIHDVRNENTRNFFR